MPDFKRTILFPCVMFAIFAGLNFYFAQHVQRLHPNVNGPTAA